MQINRHHLPAAIMALCLMLLLSQCSWRRGGPQDANHAKDSVGTTDSTGAKSSLATPMVMTYEERQGKVLFVKYCSVCHGAEGKGDGFNAFNLEPKPRDLSDKQYMSAFSDERLFQTIDLGGRGMNKSPSMPSWGGRLNRQEIRYVIAYVNSMSAK
jgi:mono/diheme cytochrome c family protein